ncbi:MAG: group 1 glycosyl transferase [Archaeoglobus sp.]|nr:MAG: group 1 glycosyl transferase [Archaeoglobus sp.]
MITVGFITRYPPTHCGIAEYSKFLISALRSLNPKMEVKVFTTRESRIDRYFDEIGVKVIPCFSRFEKDYSELVDAVNEEKVDILHVQHEYGIFGYGSEIIDALTEMKEERIAEVCVLTTHTVDHPYTTRPEVFEFQNSLNQLDAVVVHSDLQEFELITQGVDATKICQIPHGTLINPYLGYTKHFLAKSLGLDEEFCGITLAVPGFMRRDKGVDILLEALNHLKELKFTVMLAGEPQDEVVRELVENFESKTVLLERYLSSDEILRVVALADAIVLPYKDRKGAYAVSGILHLSMGGLKPILGSRTPRLVELCQHAPWMTLPPNNALELARKIEWLVNNYEFTVSYMSELYAYAARTQWISVAHELYELYKKLMRKKIVL